MGRLGGLPIDSRAPSMQQRQQQIPSVPLGVEADDVAIPLPEIVERNNNAGFYPAQDGYARDPETQEERDLARRSRYGTDWQEQQRQRQLLLNRDPMYKLVKAIAGATQRNIDRFVQGPNQELIDLQRQRAIEIARREIQIYGPNFVDLEKRAESSRNRQIALAEQLALRNEELADLNGQMENRYNDELYKNARTAKENGNWWVLPTDVRTLQSNQYSNLLRDLESVFASDGIARVTAKDYAMAPTQQNGDLIYKKLEGETGGGNIRAIDVFPYTRAIYTDAILNSIRDYEDVDSLANMSGTQTLAMAFLLMNGGAYTESAYAEFQKQLEKCDPHVLKDVSGQSEGKRFVLGRALKNFHDRALTPDGDLWNALIMLSDMALSGYSIDGSQFYRVSGTDACILFRFHLENADAADSADSLRFKLNRYKNDQLGVPMDTRPLSMKELLGDSKNSAKYTKAVVGGYLSAIEATMASTLKLYDTPFMGAVFQAWLYIINYQIGFSQFRADQLNALITANKAVSSVSKWEQTPVPLMRELIETTDKPKSRFEEIDDNQGRPAKIAASERQLDEIAHLEKYSVKISKLVLGTIDDLTEAQNAVADAIQSSQQRLIDMTRQNYDTIRRKADQLILEGVLDVTPSFFSMGNSIDYSTQPQNVGLIVLTPLAYYGIWNAYEVLQDRNIVNNDLVGLPFDEIIGSSEISIRFARFVAGLLANTGLATGSGYQAQVRSARIPFELQSAATAIFSFKYSKIHRDPITGEVLKPPKYRIYRKNAQSYATSYIAY